MYLAHHYGERPVAVSQIAKDQGIPVSYLEQILHTLKKKRWIRSLRGPQGGYVLAKRPADVFVGPVLRDLEGRRFLLEGPPVPAPKKGDKNTVGLAALLFWGKLAEDFTQLIDNTSLLKIISDARTVEKTRKSSSGFSFNI